MGENCATLAANLICSAYEILFLNEKCEELVALRTGLEKVEKRHRRTRGSSAPSPSLLSLRKKYADLLDLVKTFALSMRSVDDRLELMLRSAHFSSYVYDFSSAGGSGGLYPTDVLTVPGRILPLPLEIETVCQAGLRVYYPEIDVRRKRIYTSLYDKRKGCPEFEGIAKFPNFESRLHMGIKLQCIVS